jgi:hypothetical protein
MCFIILNQFVIGFHKPNARIMFCKKDILA